MGQRCEGSNLTRLPVAREAAVIMFVKGRHQVCQGPGPQPSPGRPRGPDVHGVRLGYQLRGIPGQRGFGGSRQC
eukprot:SAG31_NODE_2865_length_4981_cov_4.988529_8_plen_74_part_00